MVLPRELQMQLRLSICKNIAVVPGMGALQVVNGPAGLVWWESTRAKRTQSPLDSALVSSVWTPTRWQHEGGDYLTNFLLLFARFCYEMFIWRINSWLPSTAMTSIRHVWILWPYLKRCWLHCTTLHVGLEWSLISFHYIIGRSNERRYGNVEVRPSQRQMTMRFPLMENQSNRS